jgi:uncharacterized membrane protein YGL010W
MKISQKNLSQWLVEYGESHRNETNRKIHKVCVPLIFFSVVGLMLCLPWHIGPMPVGILLISIITSWYLTFGWRAYFFMAGQVFLAMLTFFFIYAVFNPLPILIFIFVAAWIGQFVGHKIEGKKPSFFKDLQFLLIGPLWVGQKFLFSSK